jgi:hypothetical protein
VLRLRSGHDTPRLRRHAVLAASVGGGLSFPVLVLVLVLVLEFGRSTLRRYLRTLRGWRRFRR